MARRRGKIEPKRINVDVIEHETKKRLRKFTPNLDTITAKLRNPTGKLPEDFFTNPRKYRKE